MAMSPTTNNAKMKNYRILEIGKDLSIVELEGSTSFIPYVLKGTELYNPANGFRPVNPKPKQKYLSEVFQVEANILIDNARASWVAPAGPEVEYVDREVVVEKIVEKEVEYKPKTPAGVIDKILAETVARMSSELAIEKVAPQIDAYIKDTYGMMPKCFEVRTPERVYKGEGVTHSKFGDILNLVSADIPVFITGPAGCGKNVICKQVAESLGLEFYFSNAVTQEYKVTGFIDAGGHYHETQFYKAFTEGGLFMLDEIDASTPEVLVILNAAIANRYFDFPTGRVEAHENFRLIAAGNTYGTGADIEYTGRYQLDASSLDRFAIIEITYDADIEEFISNGNSELVSFVRKFREVVDKNKIKFIVSYRAIERLSKLEQMFDIKESVRLAVLKGLDKEDAAQIAKNFPADFNNKYFDAYKRITM